MDSRSPRVWPRKTLPRHYPDPIWLDISAATGDDIVRIHGAVTWVCTHCVNCSKGRVGIWVSPCKVQEFSEAQAKRHAENIKRQHLDPRDKRYYELQRKNKDRLTVEEFAVYISYCEKMITFVKDDPATVQHWQQFKRELREGPINYRKRENVSVQHGTPAQPPSADAAQSGVPTVGGTGGTSGG